MEKASFSEWLERFENYLRMRNYSPRTIRSYAETVRRFAHYVWACRHAPVGDPPQFDEHNFAPEVLETWVEVPTSVVTNYFTWLAGGHAYKPRTLHRMISSLSSFYSYLYAQGAVRADPMPAVERPRIKNQELKYLKHNQVMRLLRSIDDERDCLIVRLIYATGVRVSELCTIDIGDIDFDEGTIRVRGKGDKIRTVFVDDETLAEVEDYIGNKIVGPLFEGQQGKGLSPRTVQRIFRKYAPEGITPHKIRHSYASELYRRSHNLRVVQENLGHSSIKTTEIYLHTDVDERRRVYQEYFPLSNGGDRRH
ncbi:MAG: tyrosine-type recombinase/integrase [Methanofollis sp.]|nr:tyrosine-type recombinase/integrase [Methanofollis sp.]